MTKQNPPAQSSSPEVGTAIEERVLAFAEEVGRFVGTIQAKTETWSNRDALNDQLTRIRDGATGLLEHFTNGQTSGRREALQARPPTQVRRPARTRTSSNNSPTVSAKRNTGRSGGIVDAPGKRHRKPAAPTRGVKHSDERIAKIKVSNEMRTRRRG